jgi:thioredoxin reductase (NADPH)
MREGAALLPGVDEHLLSVSGGQQATAPAVILATGVSYRTLGVPELEELIGAGVYYGASVSDSQAMTGMDVVIVGGANSAGQAATHLARYARSVTLLVRGASLAGSMSMYLRSEIRASERIRVRTDTEVIGGGGDGRLEHVVVRNSASGAVETLPAAGLFVMIGAVPRTDWLPEAVARDERGYVLAGADALAAQGDAVRWPLERSPLMLESSVPGVFAVGDARHGSVKRVASAVGEGSVVVAQVHEHLATRRSTRRFARDRAALPVAR